MKILIVEDEKPAVDKLLKALTTYHGKAEVVAVTGSVLETKQWLLEHPAPDFILMDIQLSDGLSLEIFEDVNVSCPVIFTTAYHEYFQKAFEYNGIDYILKPVNSDKLFHALDKYEKLKVHFTGNLQSLTRFFPSGKRQAERVLARKGNSFIPVNGEEIMYAYTEFKITYLLTATGERYTLDMTLNDLENGVNNVCFFRVSRKYLVSVQSVKSFKSAGKGRLKLELVPDPGEEVVVSQENAALFKQWLEKG